MKTTTLFTINRSQAVRLPADARMPEGVKAVTVRIRGSERIIAPVGHTWDQFFLDGPRVSDDFLEDRGPQEERERESF